MSERQDQFRRILDLVRGERRRYTLAFSALLFGTLLVYLVPLVPQAVLDAALSGERNAPFDGGQATFASLNVSLRGRGLTLTFGFNATAGAPPQRERFNAFAPVVSAPFDCHGAPSALELLPGWPPILQVVDAGGVRVTAVAAIKSAQLLTATPACPAARIWRGQQQGERLVQRRRGRGVEVAPRALHWRA